jgi:hypothetical protein
MRFDERDVHHLFPQSSSATFSSPFELLVWKSRQRAKKILPRLGKSRLDLPPGSGSGRFPVRLDQDLGVLVRLHERLDLFGYHDRYL